MSVRNTQTGQTVQLNTMGNSLRGVGQGTSVSLGSLNNSTSFYRDPANGCQSTGQTNALSRFRNRQLVYISSQGAGPSIGLNTNGFSIYNPSFLYRTTSITGTNTGTQGYVVTSGAFYGTGGNGGAGGSADAGPGGNGIPGGGGGSAIAFQSVGYVVASAGTIYGGGGGGGGGAGNYSRSDNSDYAYGGGGGGGGYGGAGGGGTYGSQPGQPASGVSGGAGGQGTQRGGNGGQVGQPGQGAGSYYSHPGGSGGGAGASISGAQSINWQGVSHN